MLLSRDNLKTYSVSLTFGLDAMTCLEASLTPSLPVTRRCTIHMLMQAEGQTRRSWFAQSRITQSLQSFASFYVRLFSK